MFAKFGALALFASLAAALQVTVTQTYTVPGGQIGVDVFVNSPDVGNYDFLLLGPNFNRDLKDNVYLDSNAQLVFDVPEDTPTGHNFHIGLAHTSDPENVVAETQAFDVQPAP